MSDNTYEVSVSQNFNYCCDVYARMKASAKRIEVDGSTMVMWEGFFTKLITDDVGLSVPYYSTIRRELIRMGCIRQLRRGGGSSASQWELLQDPTEELWHNAPAKKHMGGSKQEIANGQIHDLNTRLGRLEQNFEVLMQALADNPKGLQVAFDEPKPEKTYEVINGTEG